MIKPRFHLCNRFASEGSGVAENIKNGSSVIVRHVEGSDVENLKFTITRCGQFFKYTHYIVSPRLYHSVLSDL